MTLAKVKEQGLKKEGTRWDGEEGKEKDGMVLAIVYKETRWNQKYKFQVFLH